MTHEQFKILLDELDGTGSKTLAEKNARYSTSNDALQNFHEGAEIMGCTAAQACWGYMTKHLSALRKMIWSNDFSNRDDVMEKIQDTINYLRFIWAISEEERNKTRQPNPYINEIMYENIDCYNCKFGEVDSHEEPCVSCRLSYPYNSDSFQHFPLNFQQEA